MTGAASAPPLGQRPNEPAPGKDSLENPQGYDSNSQGGPTCPDCGLAFGEHPDFHAHGPDGAARMDLPGRELEDDQLGGDPAEG